MRLVIIAIISLLCAFAGTAQAETVIYAISGSTEQAGSVNFRAYFQLKNGIHEIVTDPTYNPSPAWEGRNAVYSLDGHRVGDYLKHIPNGLPKGMYIIGSRKVVVP